jgi:hypothetical protein
MDECEIDGTRLHDGRCPDLGMLAAEGQFILERYIPRTVKVRSGILDSFVSGTYAR